MSIRQNVQPKDEERELFRRTRRRGDTSATFRPGELLRCPGWLSYPGYNGPCGCEFREERANLHTRVIIRVSTPVHRGDPELGTTFFCHKCHTPLEKIVLLEATE